MHNPRGYVHIVARHQRYAYWRKKAGNQVEKRAAVCCEGQTTEATLCDWESDPLEQLSRQEMQRDVDSVIGWLSQVLAEALRLRFVDGLPLGEAALRAGCSREALKKRLARAKQSLMGYLHAG